MHVDSILQTTVLQFILTGGGDNRSHWVLVCVLHIVYILYQVSVVVNSVGTFMTKFKKIWMKLYQTQTFKIYVWNTSSVYVRETTPWKIVSMVEINFIHNIDISL